MLGDRLHHLRVRGFIGVHGDSAQIEAEEGSGREFVERVSAKWEWWHQQEKENEGQREQAGQVQSD